MDASGKVNELCVVGFELLPSKWLHTRDVAPDNDSMISISFFEDSWARGSAVG